MSTSQMYAVHTHTEPLSAAETDLTAHDVVRHIYRYDGGDYCLKPKMITERYDEEGNELPAIQDATEGGELVFDVWFKEAASYPWHLSQRIAIGCDENAAEEAFLQESFDNDNWRTDLWSILTMEHYQAERIAEAAPGVASA